jgi:Kef-type K+ transport system membrane component KefB
VLSLKGASLYDQNYVLLALVAAACLLLALLAYFFRDPLYRWIEKMNPPRDSG